jgi:hypothetical protein
MTVTHDRESGGAIARSEAGEDLPPAALPGSYIVNLCALSAPLAIPQPSAPELKRFRFFVSRRVTNGRELFFLHMGFFATRVESEKWLGIVRGAYPNASVSKLAATPRVVSSAPALTETQTLKVLEVRGPARDTDRGETHNASGSYSVQSRERLSGSLSEPATAARPIHSPAPQVKPANRPVPAARVFKQRGATSLEDALQTLAASEAGMDSSDSSSTTGVRHLRMEIQKKAKRPLKP